MSLSREDTSGRIDSGDCLLDQWIPSAHKRVVGVTWHKRKKQKIDLPIFLSIRASIMAMMLLLWDTVALLRVLMVVVVVMVMVGSVIAVTKIEIDLVIVVFIAAISLVHIRVLAILIVVLLV
jgi:hypothetical protein